MPVEVIMPKVDMDMATGKVAAWHIREGEAVEAGAPLFDIETDKAAMEVESPATGRLFHVRVTVGADVAIGEPIAWIYAEGEEQGEAPLPKAERAAVNQQVETVAPPVPAMDEAEALPLDKVRATPAARRAARNRAVDLGAITGSGPRGRIQAKDMEEPLRAVAQTATAPAAQEREPYKRGASRGAPLVFIHGFAADASVWSPMEEALHSGSQTLKLELPGHGSAAKMAIKDFPDIVSALRRAFDALGLERAHLVGHSLGGAVALALADTRPRQVERLTLIAPAGLGPEINGAALSGIARATRAESLGPWLKELVGDPEMISWNYVQAVAHQRRDPDLRDAQSRLADAVFPDGVQAFDLRAALARLSCPARIIWGKRDAIIPWSHALHAPGHVSLNLFEHLGHMPQIEAPEAVARLLNPAE